MASAQNAVVDLSTSPRITPTVMEEEPVDSISFSSLGSTLDSFHHDVPGFINSLITLPPSAPGAPPSIPDLRPIEKTLNELSTRLSLLSQDTSSLLEQSIHDITRTVPRLTYDLQFMRESATSLQSSLSLVQTKVKGGDSQGESETFKSLDKLTGLDKLKNRMEMARDILREAESWSTLESEITSLIEQHDWSKAGIRLEEAGKSVVVFQSTPGEYESRRTLLVSLQNQLEGALAKALDECIDKGDVVAISKLRLVFDMIERRQEFKEYYFKAKRKSIVEEWDHAVILDSSTTTVVENVNPVKFNVFLPRFYASLLAALQVEKTQIPLIFPPSSAVNILSGFLQSTLEILDPSPLARLGSLVDHHGTGGLPEVIKAYKATEELALAVQGILDATAFNTQGGLVSGNTITSSPTSPAGSTMSPDLKLSRQSSRRTMSRRFSRAPTLVEQPLSTSTEWGTTLYEPFLDLQSSYPSLERRYLSHQLRNEPSLSAVSTKSDASRALLDRATAAFGFADEAINRCLAFTHGYGAKGLLDALNGFFEDFMESQRDRVLVNDKAKSGARKETKDELDFDGLDYSTEDWGSFQLGLHVLSACKEIRDRLIKFEYRLKEALSHTEQVSKIQPSSPESFTLQETTLGAIALLQQSPLNSAELHSLLSSYNSSSPLPVAKDALTSFTREAQLFLQNIILTPFQAQLKEYPTLAVWSQPDKAQKRGDLQVPTFSLSPTDTMTRISEGLLNLLRIFEVYAADDALAFSLETLPFVDTSSLVGSPTTPGGSIGQETVLSTWVSSLSLSLLSRMTKTTLRQIKQLSTGGSAQLASDLAYLSNAVRALDVEWEDLERWKEASGVEMEEEYRRKMRDMEKGELDIWTKVMQLRGWH